MVPPDNYNNLLTAEMLPSALGLHYSPDPGLSVHQKQMEKHRAQQSDGISGPDLTPIRGPPGGATVSQANGGNRSQEAVPLGTKLWGPAQPKM